ncbi:DTW [Seminavis robusta]|uniref:tRNA-uridine aminocarboxypropyltransferase n=1 Tax=Seminavis robusta TaxID=568900 RepID=A0A9N8DVD6_9STRA|nr:DTW [Seminavis robusta]|eukprot:Sro274_g105320.1 DTW (379) ;mRNA; r:17454-18590
MKALRSWSLHLLLLLFRSCVSAWLSLNDCGRVGSIRQRTFSDDNGRFQSTTNSDIDIPQTSHDSTFLSQVEDTVSNVLNHYGRENVETSDLVLSLNPPERESFGVARCLDTRLQSFRRNKDCPRCWLQRAHCICDQCPPLMIQEESVIRRIFLLMHHKEICLAVDTAKLILACFPHHCRLVVAGIGPEYQSSMKELQEAIHQPNCLVLFPSEDAQTFADILASNSKQQQNEKREGIGSDGSVRWDLIVIDGTWSQAQKIHKRYFPPTEKGGPQRVQLSSTSLLPLHNSHNAGHQQLRRHPIDLRTISTMEATRLLLKEILGETAASTGDGTTSVWDTMLHYQKISNEAAQRQLGPPRTKATPDSQLPMQCRQPRIQPS